MPSNVNTTDKLTMESNQESIQSLGSPNAAPSARFNEKSCTEVVTRLCWICFQSEAENESAVWKSPCRCRGTTRWVHEKCLLRWIDEKQKGNAHMSVQCPQCKTFYIISLPRMCRVARVLESIDRFLNRASPFWAGALLIGSVYWTALSYGSATFVQVYGYAEGLKVIERTEYLILFIAMPAIPTCLILSRLIKWENGVIRLLRTPYNWLRRIRLINRLIPSEEEEENNQNLLYPPPDIDFDSRAHDICGALLIPTISLTMGRFLFEPIANSLHRTVLGGLTYAFVTGLMNIYLKYQQTKRYNHPIILDNTPENRQRYEQLRRFNRAAYQFSQINRSDIFY